MRIDRELCDICGTCVSVCPAAAIFVTESAVEIDPQLCLHCGACAAICPVNAVGVAE
jgi:MinD superfamily P-loop ATPase